MSDVDSLQIGIVADCSKAEQEIDKLANKMLLLQKTMFSLGNTKMNIASATNIVNGNNNIINNIQLSTWKKFFSLITYELIYFYK